MEQDKYEYFCSRYREFETDQLCELQRKRSSLEAEATMALDTVFAERGVSPSIFKQYSEVTGELPGDRGAGPSTGRKILNAVGLILLLSISSAIASMTAQMTPRWLGLLIVFCGAVYFLVNWARKKMRSRK